MTTYSYTITFNDGEIITLKAAIDHIIMVSDNQLAQGKTAPYWAYKHHAKHILDKLYSNVIQTSGNNFNDKKTED